MAQRPRPNAAVHNCAPAGHLGVQEERLRAAAERRVREQLDPEALARHYLLPKDEQIRWVGEGGRR